MKKIREYHIAHYWQEEALKMKKRNELKKKIFEMILVCAFVALNFAIVYEFLNQIF